MADKNKNYQSLPPAYQGSTMKNVKIAYAKVEPWVKLQILIAPFLYQKILHSTSMMKNQYI